MSFIPRKPTGSGNEAIFMGRVWDALWGPSGQLRDSSTVKVNRTAGGIFLKAKQNIGGGGSAAPATQTLTDRFLITSVNGDSLTGLRISNSASTPIAKPYELRLSIGQETIDGSVITYSNAAYPSPKKFWRRDATIVASGTIIKQEVIPYWILGSQILFADVNTYTSGGAFVVAGLTVGVLYTWFKGVANDASLTNGPVTLTKSNSFIASNASATLNGTANTSVRGMLWSGTVVRAVQDSNGTGVAGCFWEEESARAWSVRTDQTT